MKSVVRGLDPRIHRLKWMDGRIRSGHDTHRIRTKNG
jgi:hypothetical protein